MAERGPELPLQVDPIEALINEKFNQLIDCLNRRRDQLITEQREKWEERQTANRIHKQKQQQLIESKTHLQTELRDNIFHSMRDKMVDEIDTKLEHLEFGKVELIFECDTHQLEEAISVLGQLVERDSKPIPNYLKLQQPQISFAKRGKAPEELFWPRGVAFDEQRKLIYVANSELNLFSIVGCIKVFSVTGEYVNTFCEEQLEYPVGIAINGNEVYICDSYLHSILHFKLPEFRLVTIVGKKGNGVGEFSFPRQPTVAPNGSLFVADRMNHRVVMMSDKLEFQQSISHASMRQPFDVKLLYDEVFVLSYEDNPCLHVFSLSGEKLRSFISRGRLGNRQLKNVHFFCFDKKQNILISDYTDGSIKVFSRDGALLHTLGRTQEANKRIRPKGILVTSDNKIICASSDTFFGLHILC